MQFGIFDHMDFGGEDSLPVFYENRLKLAEIYDNIGIHAYHLAEHHGTPLGMAPSPNVFLSAIAQRTTRLRFGPLVYCLPLYHPVRLLEEICMLDQMSEGRLEMGIGRGISPIELDYYGINYEDGPVIYQEIFNLITEGLKNKNLTFKGELYQIQNMPLPLSAVQKPHPPLWYGIANPAATDWPAKNRLNVITNQTVKNTKKIVSNYQKAWSGAGWKSSDLPYLGMTRYIVIAHTKQKALCSARRGYQVWRKNFMALWNMHNKEPIGVNYPETFDGILETGQGIAGSVSQVRDEILRQCQESGINYFVCRFAFGNLTFAESRQSIELFAEHVMPELSGLK